MRDWEDLRRKREEEKGGIGGTELVVKVSSERLFCAAISTRTCGCSVFCGGTTITVLGVSRWVLTQGTDGRLVSRNSEFRQYKTVLAIRY